MTEPTKTPSYKKPTLEQIVQSVYDEVAGLDRLNSPQYIADQLGLAALLTYAADEKTEVGQRIIHQATMPGNTAAFNKAAALVGLPGVPEDTAKCMHAATGLMIFLRELRNEST